MARTKLNPWDHARPKLLDMGMTDCQIDEMTLEELQEIWPQLW